MTALSQEEAPFDATTARFGQLLKSITTDIDHEEPFTVLYGLVDLDVSTLVAITISPVVSILFTVTQASYSE